MEETIGKRIAAKRKSLGLTQDALAEQLGITAQAVSKWENDQSCPDISMLPRLAEIFGCTTDSLLGLPAREPPASTSLSPQTQEDAAEPEGFHIENGSWELKWDAGKRSSLGLALWILLFGLCLAAGVLLHRYLNFWSMAFFSGLTVFGLFGLYPKFSLFRLGCALLGVYYILKDAGVLTVYLNDELVLPLILVFLGVHLLMQALTKNHGPHFFFSHNGKPAPNSQCLCEGESFRCSTSFGENHHLITLPRLSGGSASLSFGELEIDLRGCEEIADGCQLQLESAFGELRLLIPKSCRLEPSISTAFATLNVRGEPDPDASATIYVNGRASFGEISIQYF